MAIDLEASADDAPRPVITSGLQPRALRFITVASGPRLAIGSFVVLSLLMVGGLMGGEAIRAQGSWMVGIGLMLGGVVCGLSGLLMALLGAYSTWIDLKHFRDGPLIPGVVVSVKPNIVVAMADMGRSFPGVAYGISQMTVRTFGVDRCELGTRIPCFTRPVKEVEADSIHDIMFGLMSWGTPDPSELARCFEKLGEEPFRRLEACIKRGPVPSGDMEKILLDSGLDYAGKFGRAGEGSGDPSGS